MSERTIEGPPDQAAAKLWAHIQEKTMLNGEKLPKFDSPEKAADVYVAHLTREQLEKVVRDLITILQKMRTEREDIFEKNSALEDAVGKLMKKDLLTASACFGNQFHDRAAEAHGRSFTSTYRTAIPSHGFTPDGSGPEKHGADTGGFCSVMPFSSRSNS